MTSFGIGVDRQNKIYYAGEVVKGIVRIRCRSAVKCRSVSVQLKGEAQVKWHTGSGDNRTDYDGNTLFEDQRCTIQGNLYKTGLLDNAGQNAFFDKIHNLGVTQIPCSSQETQRLQLIVQVMDYNCGRKDYLLGEILLDAPALANSGEKQSFPLTREGQSEGGKVTISAKFMPYYTHFPTTTSQSGATISVDTQQDYCLILHIHQATGLRKAHWVGKNDVYVQVYRPEDSKAGEIVAGKKLPGFKSIELPADSEIIAPFCFSLSRDAPPSAELGVGDRSFIRYTIRAYEDSANWKRAPIAQPTITVIPNHPIPKPVLIQPYYKQVGQPLYSSCCKIGKNGMVSIRLELNRIAYAAEEAVDLRRSTILYEGSKVVYADVFLVGLYQLHTFFSSTNSKRHYSLGPRVRLVPHQEVSLNNTAYRVPASVYPSFYGGVTEKERMSMRYACLKWTYMIAIVVGGDRCMSSAVAALPILISASPPNESALAEYKGLAPKSVSFGSWDIFEHAVLGPDEGSNIEPSITGPEDGGTTVNVGGAEDNYCVGSGGQESMSYQPMVTTFDGPQDSPQPAAFTDTTSAPSSASADIRTLLQTMEGEFDKRLAVGQWIRQHPEEAQLLSPEDFHSILGKVTISLDQPSVVGELLAGCEATNKLTCRHITKTIAACQNRKTEVASMMAPYVNDPENKDLVLQQLDYSFAKSCVSARFAAK